MQWKKSVFLSTHKCDGKAPGADCIHAEVYKEGGEALTEKLHDLFALIWKDEIVPQELKDAAIVHLYKRKGNRQSCDNHRGISLLSIAGKTESSSIDS